MTRGAGGHGRKPECHMVILSAISSRTLPIVRCCLSRWYELCPRAVMACRTSWKFSGEGTKVDWEGSGTSAPRFGLLGSFMLVRLRAL